MNISETDSTETTNPERAGSGTGCAEVTIEWVPSRDAVIAQLGARAVTIRDLRDVAATIDRPESEPEQLIAKAERALRGHAAHLSLDATLRKMWCDTNVRECVAAVAQARRALDAAE